MHTPRQIAYQIFLVIVSAFLWNGLPAEVRADDPRRQPAIPAQVEFNRDIRRILSDTCFQCHGPDERTREADLRLDQRAAAVADRGGYAAITPGEPARSEIWERISSRDPAVRMPPPESQKSLSARDRLLLKKWIEQGAEYEPHWAFLPLRKSTPPRAGDDWAVNPIDRYVARKHGEFDFKPSPQADPRTLIRRMSLDLTGLLPAPDEVERFISAFQEDDDAAVSALADRLLNSRHYGERWGRHWLDQARYADSHGYTIDCERTMWPYRDWVIRAFNRDLPFDQFTIEQLAGDLLPSPTKSQRIATGFHRNTLINQEGGTDAEQFRNEEVVDRVNTTAAVWMGLTYGCAQCHSHKFDPISHREYYELFDFFNHTVDRNNTGPTVIVRQGELFLDLADEQLLTELKQAEAEVVTLQKSQPQRQRVWEQRLIEQSPASEPVEWTALRPVRWKSRGNAAFELLEDQSLVVGRGAANEVYTVSLRSPTTPARSRLSAVRLRVLPHKSLPKQGPGRAGNGNFVITSVEVHVDGKRLAIARVQADHSQPGYPAAALVDGDPQTGWAINVGRETSPSVKMNAPHEAQLILKNSVPAGWKSMQLIIRHERNANYNLGRFAVDVSARTPHSPDHQQLLDAVKTAANKRSAVEKKLLSKHFVGADTPLIDAQNRVQTLSQKLGLGRTASVMVMQELPQPRETYIHVRGDFLRKDRDVGLLTADGPAVLPPIHKDGEGNNLPRKTRLDLAKWLVSPEHPLTSRVTVNRIWMRYFGRGLVKTENDFGTQGELPTHPELLDWLARWFMQDARWSQKALHKLIVTSATYRQSSRHRPELSHRDPLNKWLARQNRLRVDAEIVRDLALSASGLLTPVIGGPGVRPPQPEGVYAFTQNRKSWNAATGADRYRRGLYIQFFRSAPYPLLTTFDAPDFQTVCTRRPRSNTPLQSLTMSNDAALFETYQGLAWRLLHELPAEGNSAENLNAERLKRVFQLCYSRLPKLRETEVLSKFLSEQQTAFARDLAAARKVAGMPTAVRTALGLEDHAGPSDTEFAAAASWTLVARVLMNTDEFITRE